MERALRVVDGFQQGSAARRGRHVSDEVPASVVIGPVQPPFHSAMPQSREGTGSPFRAERCVGGIPRHSAFHQGHVVTADLVFEAYLMLGTLGDPLLTPALDASEIGLRKIKSHPGSLSIDIGELRRRDVFEIPVLPPNCKTTAGVM